MNKIAISHIFTHFTGSIHNFRVKEHFMTETNQVVVFLSKYWGLKVIAKVSSHFCNEFYQWRKNYPHLTVSKITPYAFLTSFKKCLYNTVHILYKCVILYTVIQMILYIVVSPVGKQSEMWVYSNARVLPSPSNAH